MANYQNIKPVIMLDKDPLVKEAKTVKVSALLKSIVKDAKNLVSLEVYANNETKGVKYLVLTCPTVFVQTLGDMCLDTKIVRLYEHCVLRRSNLLSTYWREACAKNSDKKTGNIWEKEHLPPL